jgi:hypothetical protein
MRLRLFLAGMAAGLGLAAASVAGYAAAGPARHAGGIAPADRAAIEDLMVRYAHLIDAHEAAAWAATFTDDGVLDFPGTHVAGRAELLAFAARERDPRRTHFPGAPILVQTGPDRVVARSKVLMTAPDPAGGGRMVFDGIGVYEDEIARTPDGWRFARRRAAVDLPMAPEFLTR